MTFSLWYDTDDIFVYLFFFLGSILILLPLVSLISNFGFIPITVLFLAINVPIVLSPLLDGYLLYIQSVKRNLINFIEKNDDEKLNELQKQGKISDMPSSSLEHDNSMFNSSQTQEKKSFYPLEIEAPVLR